MSGLPPPPPSPRPPTTWSSAKGRRPGRLRLYGVPILAVLVGGALGFGVSVLTLDDEAGTGTGAIAVPLSPGVEAPTGSTGPAARTGTTGATGSTGSEASTGSTGPSATGPTTQGSPDGGSDGTVARPIPLGDAAGAAGWSVAVIAFDPNATGTVERANRGNEPPRRGVYVTVGVRFERTGTTGGDPWLDIEAALIVDGKSYPEARDVCCLTDAWNGIGTVLPGATGIGTIAFDVPKEGLEDAVLYLVITDPASLERTEGYFSVTRA